MADEPIRRRTPAEVGAYIQGFEAGVETALREVAKSNFGDVAKKARPKIQLSLDAVRFARELVDAE